jgi:hypothetical protein
MKRLSNAIYSMKDVTLGYDETKPLARFLWSVFAGWDFITGYREEDIVKIRPSRARKARQRRHGSSCMLNAIVLLVVIAVLAAELVWIMREGG